jgi:hypothetical protein
MSDEPIAKFIITLGPLPSMDIAVRPAEQRTPYPPDTGFLARQIDPTRPGKNSAFSGVDVRFGS